MVIVTVHSDLMELKFHGLYIYIHPYIGSMYAIYGNIYHQHTPNVSIYTSTMDPMGYIYNVNMALINPPTIKYANSRFAIIKPPAIK